ncbi:unnamed protein product, partial [Meganyctiphanes norvegica]
MVLFGVALLVAAMVITAECQVHFPSSDPEPDNRISNDCTASNGQKGTCYEFRSTNFKECSFFPSLDSTNPDVKSHLELNLCRNTGREAYFCCPSATSTTPAEEITAATRTGIFPSEKECGMSQRFNVVGGESTAAGDWPWLAAILGNVFPSRERSVFCGATLITKQHVISAAHCFKKRFPNTIVRLGEYNVSIPNSLDGGQDFEIVDERIANYDRVTKENDLILLKLDRPVNQFTDFIRAACLPFHLRNDPFDGKTLEVVGWGLVVVETLTYTDTPLLGKVPVVPLSECQEAYKKKSSSLVDNRQLCAGTGVTDSCRGDSGGPLNYLDFNTGRFYIVGVVSFGPKNCGDSNLPGVYGRIGSYLDWIEEKVREML